MENVNISLTPEQVTRARRAFNLAGHVLTQEALGDPEGAEDASRKHGTTVEAELNGLRDLWEIFAAVDTAD